MKALRYVLYGLVILAAVGLLCYYAFWEKDLSATNITKCALICAGAILGILKSGQRRTPTSKKATYQKAYGEFIRDAFSDDPKLENRLYSAINDYNLSRPSSAISKLEKLRKQCQRTADIYAVTVFLALCHDDMGSFEEAIRYYQTASGIRRNSTLSSNMGLAYQRTGKFEEAEEAYRQAILIDPDNTYAMNNLAVLHFRRGKYEESLAQSKAVLEKDASLIQALSNAALCCALTGRDEEYKAYYRRAVSCGYDGRKIKNFLARMDLEEETSTD